MTAELSKKTRDVEQLQNELRVKTIQFNESVAAVNAERDRISAQFGALKQQLEQERLAKETKRGMFER